MKKPVLMGLRYMALMDILSVNFSELKPIVERIGGAGH